VAKQVHPIVTPQREDCKRRHLTVNRRFGALLFELAAKLAHPVPALPGDPDGANTIFNFGGLL
jgi:hypothetical protein